MGTFVLEVLNMGLNKVGRGGGIQCIKNHRGEVVSSDQVLPGGLGHKMSGSQQPRGTECFVNYFMDGIRDVDRSL